MSNITDIRKFCVTLAGELTNGEGLIEFAKEIEKYIAEERDDASYKKYVCPACRRVIKVNPNYIDNLKCKCNLFTKWALV